MSNKPIMTKQMWQERVEQYRNDPAHNYYNKAMANINTYAMPIIIFHPTTGQLVHKLDDNSQNKIDALIKERNDYLDNMYPDIRLEPHPTFEEESERNWGNMLHIIDTMDMASLNLIKLERQSGIKPTKHRVPRKLKKKLKHATRN